MRLSSFGGYGLALARWRLWLLALSDAPRKSYLKTDHVLRYLKLHFHGKISTTARLHREIPRKVNHPGDHENPDRIVGCSGRYRSGCARLERSDPVQTLRSDCIRAGRPAGSMGRDRVAQEQAAAVLLLGPARAAEPPGRTHTLRSLSLFLSSPSLCRSIFILNSQLVKSLVSH